MGGCGLVTERSIQGNQIKGIIMNLQEIKEREARADKGPWKWANNSYNDPTGYYSYEGAVLLNGDDVEVLSATEASGPDSSGGGCPPELANSLFIAHAREDIPALIAEVERLQEENKQLREVCQAFYDFSTDEQFAFWPEQTFTQKLNGIVEMASKVLKQ